jgi:hypothetical protein
VILLVFFLTASTSASLAQKTPALGMATVMILLFLRKDTRWHLTGEGGPSR